MTKIKDDNDDLVDVPMEEYKETPGGFCKLNIDLDPDVLDTLVDQWAEFELHPASLEMYTSTWSKMVVREVQHF